MASRARARGDADRPREGSVGEVAAAHRMASGHAAAGAAAVPPADARARGDRALQRGRLGRHRLRRAAPDRDGLQGECGHRRAAEPGDGARRPTTSRARRARCRGPSIGPSRRACAPPVPRRPVSVSELSEDDQNRYIDRKEQRRKARIMRAARLAAGVDHREATSELERFERNYKRLEERGELKEEEETQTKPTTEVADDGGQVRVHRRTDKEDEPEVAYEAVVKVGRDTSLKTVEWNVPVTMSAEQFAKRQLGARDVSDSESELLPRLRRPRHSHLHEGLRAQRDQLGGRGASLRICGYCGGRACARQRGEGAPRRDRGKLTAAPANNRHALKSRAHACRRRCAV